MKLERLLDSIYLIPVILDHMDKPCTNTRAILRANDISDEQVAELHKIRHLLEYHKQVVQNKYSGNYPLLRQGLREYYETYLSSMFKAVGLTSCRLFGLDYGCGDGQVAEQFLEDNPESEIVLLDKEPVFNQKSLTIDFEKEPNWWSNYIGAFSLVILSEVLHCKAPIAQHYLIDSSHNVLADHGFLLISENIDHCMEYRISKIKKKSYPVVDSYEIAQLTYKKFELIKETQINNHKIYLYEKI